MVGVQQILLVLAITALFVGVFLLAGGGAGPGLLTAPRVPSGLEPEEEEGVEQVERAVRLEIGEAIAWDGTPVDVPVFLTGSPLGIRFVIEFERHVVRVTGAESSADWDTHVIRSNEEGKVSVRAERIRPTAERHRLLTLRFRRIADEDAPLMIPKDSIVARFATETRLGMTVIPGAVRVPNF